MGFYTSKWIEIPDCKIGRLFNALLALLLGVVVYKSVYNKAFLEYDTPVGFVNAKITDWNAPETPPAYCTSHPKIPCRVLDEYEAQYPTTEGDSITLTTRVKEVVDEQQQNGTWCVLSALRFSIYCRVASLWQLAGFTDSVERPQPTDNALPAVS